jgi:hypothetical protein
MVVGDARTSRYGALALTARLGWAVAIGDAGAERDGISLAGAALPGTPSTHALASARTSPIRETRHVRTWRAAVAARALRRPRQPDDDHVLAGVSVRAGLAFGAVGAAEEVAPVRGVHKAVVRTAPAGLRAATGRAVVAVRPAPRIVIRVAVVPLCACVRRGAADLPVRAERIVRAESWIARADGAGLELLLRRPGAAAGELAASAGDARTVSVGPAAFHAERPREIAHLPERAVEIRGAAPQGEATPGGCVAEEIGTEAVLVLLAAGFVLTETRSVAELARRTRLVGPAVTHARLGLAAVCAGGAAAVRVPGAARRLEVRVPARNDQDRSRHHGERGSGKEGGGWLPEKISHRCVRSPFGSFPFVRGYGRKPLLTATV